MRKFVKKFRVQPHNEDQVMHTFRELILGAFLSMNGLKVRYEFKIDSKSPDWCILNDDESLSGIIELINFHIDRATETSQKQVIESGRVWCDWMKPNNARLYQKIEEKINIYDALIKKYKVPYIISVFGDFTAFIEMDVLHQCLFQDHGGIFNQYTIISGVLFFEESLGRYHFNYIANPRTIVEINLPTGII